MQYHLTVNDINHEEVSRDLDLPITHVKAYFDNYALYKSFPIRTLTFDEENLAKAIKSVSIMTNVQIKSIIDDKNINIADLKKDPLLVERSIANYVDEERYNITVKYLKFILEPAVLYGNFEAPLTKPLSMEEVVVLLSNMAVGISKTSHLIDPRVQLSALSKIADIYSTTRILNETNKSTLDEDRLNQLTPAQLNEIVTMVEQPHLRTALDKLNENREKEAIKKKQTTKKATVKNPPIQKESEQIIVKEEVKENETSNES